MKSIFLKKHLNILSMMSVLPFFVTSTVFAKVPTSWLNGDDHSSRYSGIQLFGVGIPSSTVATVASDAEKSGVGNDIDRILTTGDSILSFKGSQKVSDSSNSSSNFKVNRPWYLQSIKTEVGIEGSGEIGLLGVEGEAALELIWMRTSESIKRLQAEAGMTPPLSAAPPVTEDQGTVSLSTSMSHKEVTKKIDGIVEYLGQNHKVSNLGKLRSQLLVRTQELQGWVGQFEQIPDDFFWKPYKYQVELFVQGEGTVVPAVEVGVVARVRLEWTLSRKSVSQNLNGVVTASSQNALTPMLRSLAEDLVTLDNLSSEENPYPLIAVKVGLGVGASGDIGIAEGKGTLIGSVFLKPNRKRVTIVGAEAPLQASVEDANHYGIPRDKFRMGLIKAAEMTRFIAKTAEKHELKADESKKQREFELGAIEVELALTLEGGTFLPSISKNAVMELFLMKKSRMGQGGSL